MFQLVGLVSLQSLRIEFRCSSLLRGKVEKEESGLSMDVGPDETALMRCLLQVVAVGCVAFELMSG